MQKEATVMLYFGRIRTRFTASSFRSCSLPSFSVVSWTAGLTTELAACLKPPSRDNHRKTHSMYVTRVGVELRSRDCDHIVIIKMVLGAFNSLGHAASGLLC